MHYGYVRVSSNDQNVSRQVRALSEQGVKRKNIYIDKQSGKDFNRTKYTELMSIMKEGDVLFVKSIDRFGRNYTEILEQWRIITKDKLCDIVVIDMPLLDTRKSKDLTGTLISDIVLQLLSYVAQQEREFIRQRQAEGIAAAKERGVKFGRPAIRKPDNFLAIKEKWIKGEVTAGKAAEMLGISRRTFGKWVKEKSWE